MDHKFKLIAKGGKFLYYECEKHEYYSIDTDLDTYLAGEGWKIFECDSKVCRWENNFSTRHGYEVMRCIECGEERIRYGGREYIDYNNGEYTCMERLIRGIL